MILEDIIARQAHHMVLRFNTFGLFTTFLINVLILASLLLCAT